ncbi:hypothetical protein HY638_00855 [Candidatus Woesearchaeota archaeon]|nr:hypothetical protein [Candidatus Woesearchaeota archaeon]
MKTLWKVLAWIAAICGLIAYSVGWLALMTSEIWVPTQYWFYDAISAGIFALFFLIYGAHSGKK